MTERASLGAEPFKRPDIEAPLIVWEYAMTLERWVLNAEERAARYETALREITKTPARDWHTNAQIARLALYE